MRRLSRVVLALLVRSTMSYGNEEASTQRRDARPVLAPETLDDSVHALEVSTEPPTRLRANATPATPYVQRSAVQPRVPHGYEQPSYVQPSDEPRERTEPSVHAMQPAIPALPRLRSRRDTAAVVPAHPAAVEAPHPADVAAARRSSQKIATDASRSAHSSSRTRERKPTVEAKRESVVHPAAVAPGHAPSEHSSSRSARGSSPGVAVAPAPAPDAKRAASAAVPASAAKRADSEAAPASAAKRVEGAPAAKPTTEAAPEARSRSASASKSASQSASKSTSEPKFARGSSPSVVGSAPADPAPEIPGMIDPMLVTLPPELGPSIYSWVRRLALQADLQTADRVLRDALTEITSSLSVTIVYPGQDGLWSLGPDDEIPKETTPIIACAQARRALIASHTALIPIITTSETVGVVVLTRNPRNPGYLPVEQIAMIGLARESASILHHLAVQHLQKAHEQKADKGGLYRGEALEAHRTRGNEGVLVQLSPGWVKRAYPLLALALVIAAAFSIFITVPTYSSGSGVVYIDGVTVSAQQGGTVDAVLVQPGQSVNAGTAVVRLSAQAELDELTAAQTEHNGILQQMLFDSTDEQVKKQLHASHNRLTLAEARVNAKTVRAPHAGTISDIRVRSGQPLQPGEPIATIVQPGAEPQIFAFLPSKDRPRLRTGQVIQIELVGYTKGREQAIITYVGTEAIGANEAAKTLGQTLADALKLPLGSYVLVKARLPSRTFKTQHSVLNYHHGLLAKTEVKISEKPFLVSLLPALEKYLPD